MASPKRRPHTPSALQGTMQVRPHGSALPVVQMRSARAVFRSQHGVSRCITSLHTQQLSGTARRHHSGAVCAAVAAEAPDAAAHDATASAARGLDARNSSAPRGRDARDSSAPADAHDTDASEAPAGPWTQPHPDFIEKLRGELILAPLTKYGNLPFRRLCLDLGANVTMGEMMFARMLLKRNRQEKARLRQAENEHIFGEWAVASAFLWC